jgi:hypothetical protein
MYSNDIHIRYSSENVILDKIAKFSVEDNLVYRDERDSFRAQVTTTAKFAMITAASPLVALVRIVRAVVFACTGDFNRAGREFIGGLTVPLIASACLVGSLISCAAYVLDLETESLHVRMKRFYAHFEAWVNDIDLHSVSLASFANRVSLPLDFVGSQHSFHPYVWTTAPCMQPILENGYSYYKGIFDVQRMRKIFPHIEVHDVHVEHGKIVIQSEYQDKDYSVKICSGTCEHARSAMTYCCWRAEMAYDRILCCDVGQGNCTSIADHNDTCGFIFCTVGCVGVCCCTERNNLVSVDTCLLT